MIIHVWSIGLQKFTKMIENHVHIRSTDHSNRLVVWMTDAFGFAFA